MSLITAIVSIDVEADKIPEAAETIVEIDGVTEVYSVTGDWDLGVVVRAPNHDDLAEIIPNLISKVDGVIRIARPAWRPLKIQPPRNVPSSALLP